MSIIFVIRKFPSPFLKTNFDEIIMVLYMTKIGPYGFWPFAPSVQATREDQKKHYVFKSGMGLKFPFLRWVF